MVKGMITLIGLLIAVEGAFASEMTLPMGANPLEIAGRSGAVNQIDNLSGTRDLEKLRHHVGTTVDAILATAIRNLRKQGHHEYANQLEAEWTQSYSLYFFGTGLALMDLGDHDPLIPWLANVMGNVEKRGGKGFTKRTRIDDLRIINYALPVVFRPTGNKKTGQEWGSEEYGKHFNPLLGVVTYWTARIACKQLAQSQPVVSRFCSNIAGVAEKIVVSRVAPRLSATIYSNAMKRRKK